MTHADFRRNCGFIGLGLAVILAGCKRETSPPQAPPSAVSAVTASRPTERPTGRWVAVERRSVTQTTPAVGSFRARQTTLLGSQVAGRVAEVLVDVGEIVRSGQELMRLDPTFFAIEIGQREADTEAARVKLAGARETVNALEAEVQVARTALAEAELEYTRMKNLWEKPSGEMPSISKQRYDAARFAHEQAQARVVAAQSRVAEQEAKLREHEAGVKQAEEALRYAMERLDEATIRAPYDAIVARRLVDPGEPVTATPVTHLLEVQEVGTLYLEYALPQELLSAVKPGTPVTFDAEGVTEDDVEAQTTMSVVYPTLDEATRSFRCRSVVANLKLTFRPGMLASVKVAVGQAQDVPVVPRSALKDTARGPAVMVANDGHPVERNIEVGAMDGSWAEVRSGLSEGDRVLVPETE
ncbi:MAG: efflux RND transporter periplasmic adaptor subunit [Planctomycetes bacterium]|nr:efflux RND transporter periplasmic adaptor subunit [Planctomycetota bacterium]RIK71128.1 MAG: hypothetical protein DCC66_02890 [Planctomycetota bacterium]